MQAVFHQCTHILHMPIGHNISWNPRSNRQIIFLSFLQSHSSIVIKTHFKWGFRQTKDSNIKIYSYTSFVFHIYSQITTKSVPYYKIHILGTSFPKFLITNDGKFGLSISSNNMRRMEKTKNRNFMTHYRNDT